MDEEFIEGFSFDDNRFPHGFLVSYEAMECLSSNETGETLLVKDKQAGTYFIAKCYTDKTFLSGTTESDLLKNLCHLGLPAFIGEYKNDEMLCVVREYVEGIPLDQYVAERKLTKEQAISIGLQLCDILSYLHGQKPPIIHRDIKPQNIIVNNAGKIKLIDFGISRIYNEAAREDTLCFGTKYFASPEQYGFSQTDCRSDIFSFGVLLSWLLTGELDLKIGLPEIEDKYLLEIIKKCTAFAPEKRYNSADEVKAALLRIHGTKQNNVLKGTFAALICAVFLCTGFFIGLYTDFTPVFLTSPGVSFKEPLVEQAVRLSLGKQKSETIAEEELASVTELYIYGDKAAGSFDEFEAIGQHRLKNDGTIHNGGISTLKDLTMLKNLRKLNMAWQNISNITPLGELHSLEQIQLKHTPIEDVAPLSSLSKLRELYLYDTSVSDMTVLSNCSMLENISAGGTSITSIKAFEGIKGLKHLDLKDRPVETLSGIGEFTKLESISLSSVIDGDLSPLVKLPRLKEVFLDEELRDAAEASLKSASFEIIYQ